MSPHPPPFPQPAPQRERRLVAAYLGLCALCWMLYAMAGAEWQRGLWRLWEAAYEATLNLWAPMLLGAAVYPWVRWLQRRPPAVRWLLHGLAALLFGAAWQALEGALAWALFGADHALASWQQRVLWRAVWGVFAYLALALGFAGVLHARRAAASALAAAQAESALVRAELAAIGSRLNPHFLFNTLNSLIALTRKDGAAAEQGLLGFARMMRYVLDTQRGAEGRVALREEIDFVRDYLALEALRLGPRLRVQWQLDAAVLDEPVPPLTLQPLVENAVRHGIAPRVEGGTVSIAARRDGAALQLSVADDGSGCDQAVPAGGVGLAALRRRFALDYGGRAGLAVHTAPGAGFRVEIHIPCNDAAA
jgi:signal transduction histidine kinase